MPIILKSKSEREALKRLERIANKAKKKVDELTDHANKPDSEKLSIFELAQTPGKRRKKMRTYPNMGKNKV